MGGALARRHDWSRRSLRRVKRPAGNVLASRVRGNYPPVALASARSAICFPTALLGGEPGSDDLRWDVECVLEEKPVLTFVIKASKFRGTLRQEKNLLSLFEIATLYLQGRGFQTAFGVNALYSCVYGVRCWRHIARPAGPRRGEPHTLEHRL